MESGGRLPECVLESDDVEVAMVTIARGEERWRSLKTVASWLSACLQYRGHEVFVLTMSVQKRLRCFRIQMVLCMQRGSLQLPDF